MVAGQGSQHIVELLAHNFTLIVTVFSIFAGSLAAGLAGFAFSAISGAILFHWLAPIEAVPLLLACSITTQLLSITRLWHTMRWRQCVPYLLGGFAGVPVGTKLLENFSPHTFAVWFGIFLICYSLHTLLRPGLIFSPAVPRPFPVLFRRSGATQRVCRKPTSVESSSHLFSSCRSQR